MRLQRKSLHQFYFAAIIYSLFQRGQVPEEIVDEILGVNDEESEFSRIRCPLCRWQPNATSMWECGDCGFPEYFYDACGMVWNTFTTRGLCPGCGHQWLWTSCLRCDEWSLHKEWYATENKTDCF